jgi:hypothetical protein
VPSWIDTAFVVLLCAILYRVDVVRVQLWTY